MKKKIITALSLIAVLAVSITVLAGCISKPPHKMFSDPWLTKEVAVYDVTRTLKDEAKTTLEGTSTVTTERITNKAIAFGDETKGVGVYANDNFTGTLVSIETTMDDGSIMNAYVAFKTNLEPLASYKHIDIKTADDGTAQDRVQTTMLKYVSEKCEYTAKHNGETKTGSVKLKEWIKSPFYDNLMAYHIARSSYFDGGFQSLSLSIISTDTFELKTMTAGKAGVAAIKYGEEGDENDKGIPCDVINILLNNNAPLGSGTPLVAYINQDAVENYHGINLTRGRYLISFVEGSMTYKLSSLTEI